MLGRRGSPTAPQGLGAAVGAVAQTSSRQPAGNLVPEPSVRLGEHHGPVDLKVRGCSHQRCRSTVSDLYTEAQSAKEAGECGGRRWSGVARTPVPVVISPPAPAVMQSCTHIAPEREKGVKSMFAFTLQAQNLRLASRWPQMAHMSRAMCGPVPAQVRDAPHAIPELLRALLDILGIVLCPPASPRSPAARHRHRHRHRHRRSPSPPRQKTAHGLPPQARAGAGHASAPWFYTPGALVPLPPGALLRLGPDESRHAARTLRLRGGDVLRLCDGRGALVLAEVESVEERAGVLVRTLEPAAQVLARIPSAAHSFCPRCVPPRCASTFLRPAPPHLARAG